MNELNNKQELKYKRIRLILQILVVTLVLGAIVFIAVKLIPYVIKLDKSPEFREEIAGRLKSMGPWAMFALTGIQILQTIFMFIPAGPVVIITGMIYPAWSASIIAIVGQTLGGVIVFLLIKLLGMRFIALFVDPKKITESKLLKNKTRSAVIMFSYLLIPVLPKDIIAFVAPFTGMSLKTFILINVVARTPMTIVTTLIGSSLISGDYLTLLITGGASLIVAILCLVFHKKIEEKIDSLGKKGEDLIEEK